MSAKEVGNIIGAIIALPLVIAINLIPLAIAVVFVVFLLQMMGVL